MSLLWSYGKYNSVADEHNMVVAYLEGMSDLQPSESHPSPWNESWNIGPSDESRCNDTLTPTTCYDSCAALNRCTVSGSTIPNPKSNDILNSYLLQDEKCRWYLFRAVEFFKICIFFHNPNVNYRRFRESQI